MARRAYLYSTSLVLRWMVRLNIGVLLLLFAASPVVVPIFFNIARAAGTTYYVDNCVNTGSDSYDGIEQAHTTGNTGPWLTINKVNTSSFNPGDSVLFRRTCKWGGAWQEMLNAPSAGSSGNPITFGAYGTGALPTIDGSILIPGGSWSLYSGNVWQASLTTQPYLVFFNGTRGTYETSTGALTGAMEWYLGVQGGSPHARGSGAPLCHLRHARFGPIARCPRALTLGSAR